MSTAVKVILGCKKKKKTVRNKRDYERLQKNSRRKFFWKKPKGSEDRGLGQSLQPLEASAKVQTGRDFRSEPENISQNQSRTKI